MEDSLAPLVERIRAAVRDGQALRPRGGGTKDFIAERLDGEVLDTRGHAGIVRHEPSELYVTARCGTALAELESVLASAGQCLPFEPPHFGAGSALGASGATFSGTSATVGGMVAAGLSGPARASVGSVRDYVLGATVVNGRGETLVFGGQVMKNVAGYDLSRLYAGSWGTLGLIAEVTLKVLPVAPAEATLRFELDAQAALDRINAWGGQPLPLNASRWHGDGGPGELLVRLRGARAAVEAACARMGGQRLDAAQAMPGWGDLRELRLPFFTQPPSAQHALWRLSVAQTAPALSLDGPQLIDWHGAQRWLWAPMAEARRIHEAARAAGGHASLLLAPAQGEVPAGLRFAPLAPPLDRIHRELKAQFDPAGIFSRGRTGWY